MNKAVKRALDEWSNKTMVALGFWKSRRFENRSLQIRGADVITAIELGIKEGERCKEG